MEFEKNSGIQRGPLSAIERAQLLSQALADAARRARISKRSRRYLSSGGFEARSGAKAWRLGVTISFVVMVVIPSLVAFLYLEFMASEQYVAEAKFTISGGELPSSDAIGSITGVPLVAIIQDTLIVTNYIQSRPAVEKLDTQVGLRVRYARPDADWLSRFNPKKPVEKLVDYWKHMSSVSITMPSGIVNLRVWAFTPKDAVTIANSVLEISESLINDINERMTHDAVFEAEQELNRSFDRLTKAQVALETARNDTGLIDAVKVSDSINKLLTDTRSTLLQLQQEYATDVKYVAADAPQMRALKARIDTTTLQIAELESKLTQTKLSSPDQPTLASSMTKFSELDLEHDVADKLYIGAAASLEMARIMAEHKMMYIDTFVRPVAPQEAEYPRRLLFSAAIFGGSLAIWGLCLGVATLIRNYGA